MTGTGWLQIAVFGALITAMIKPLGGYIARLVQGESRAQRYLAPLENGIYRLAGVDPSEEQGWATYALALILFHAAGIVLLYALQRFQNMLLFNPQGMGPVSPDLALNTAVSFATNTSWQSYSGEATLGYLVQMAGIAVQCFLSGASGIAVAVALIRGFARRSSATIGNFWVDITRITLYLLLPICVAAALFLIWSGVPQSLGPYVHATTLEGANQVLARGPVASQEAIKLLSGDGGGFFNTNSAHPFENPTGLTGMFEMLLIFLIGAALTNTFGRMVRDPRQGWVLYAAMVIMFAAGLALTYASETAPNAAFASHEIDQLAGPFQGGGHMEGKEVRFGAAQSSLFATVATASSDGAVDSMHDSFAPVSGLVLLSNMMLDEVIVGGPGSGLFGMLLFAIVSVFIAGLMIGRTPEYLGKKIEANEVKMTMIALLWVPACVLSLTATAAILPFAVANLTNTGPHGFTELLYAFSSGAATNGSAFAGLNANSPFFNLTLAAAMFLGRFAVIVPVLCIAGLLAAKRIVPASLGTMPTHGPLFIGLLIASAVIVGGLTFFPALALGPIAEALAR
jgi:potassium-transporting ATPase potassium-binding subunit